MDPIIVTLPDGQEVEFPAGTPREVMRDAMRRHVAKQQAAQPAPAAPAQPAGPAPAPTIGEPPSQGERYDSNGRVMGRGDRMLADIGEGINTGINWLGTRGTNAAAAIIGTPRAYADATQAGADYVASKALGRPVTNAPNPLSPLTPIINRLAPGYRDVATPSADDIKGKVYGDFGVPQVNLPGTAGKVIDTGVEAALSAVATPGSLPRTVGPAFVGGASSEVAGEATKGTKWEPVARVAAGLVGAGATVAAQEAARAGGRVAVNALGRNDPDATAARLAARAVENDKMTPQTFGARMAEIGPDGLPINAGGENVRGLARGATVRPGEARTTMRNALDAQADLEPGRVGDTINRNVSPQGLVGTVDDLAKARAAAASPAYQAAGIPQNPKDFWGAAVDWVQATISGKKPDGPPPVLKSPALEELVGQSSILRGAINGVKAEIPDYRGLPDTSMIMLDKAYKRVGGLAAEARRSGDGVRAHDLELVRSQLLSAITKENPLYADALRAYAGPSALIEAAELGRKSIAANVRPDAVKRDFSALTKPEQDAWLVGVAEELRTRAGRRDATGVAGRVVVGPDDRARLQAILPPDRYKRIVADIEKWKGFTADSRAVGAGSRTAPMTAEGGAIDDAVASAAGNFARGNVVSGVVNALSAGSKRLIEGQNEQVSARIAKMLTAATPEEQAAVVAALEKAMLAKRAGRTGTVNALISPLGAVGVNAIGRGAPAP